VNRENVIQPFPGRKIQLVYLPERKIRISWKHHENSLIERISIGLLSIPFLMYWGYFVHAFIKPPIEIIYDFIHYHSEKFNFITFILGILSLLIAILIFSFWLSVLLYPWVRMLLNLVVDIKGTGKSKLFLNDDELIYSEGQYPNIFNSKDNILVEEKSRFSEDMSINEALNFLLKRIYDWQFLILSKAAITFSKQEIQDIQIEPVEERSKLFIIINNQKIAVGKYLYNSDKEWLYQIITQWLNFS